MEGVLIFAILFNEISLNLSDEVIHNILDAQTKEQTPEKLLPPSHFVCPV